MSLLPTTTTLDPLIRPAVTHVHHPSVPPLLSLVAIAIACGPRFEAMLEQHLSSSDALHARITQAWVTAELLAEDMLQHGAQQGVQQAKGAALPKEGLQPCGTQQGVQQAQGAQPEEGVRVQQAQEVQPGQGVQQSKGAWPEQGQQAKGGVCTA